jgi:hypothetical protein
MAVDIILKARKHDKGSNKIRISTSEAWVMEHGNKKVSSFFISNRFSCERMCFAPFL